MINSTQAASGGSSSQTTGSAAASAVSSSVSQNQFLQLLVAQLKNQDPLNPQDGTQFLSQLAQFSQLEQLLAVRSDLDKLAGASTGGSGSGTGTNQSGSTPTGSSQGNNIPIQSTPGQGSTSHATRPAHSIQETYHV